APKLAESVWLSLLGSEKAPRFRAQRDYLIDEVIHGTYLSFRVQSIKQYRIVDLPREDPLIWRADGLIQGDAHEAYEPSGLSAGVWRNCSQCAGSGATLPPASTTLVAQRESHLGARDCGRIVYAAVVRGRCLVV